MTDSTKAGGMPAGAARRLLEVLDESNWPAIARRWPQLDDPAMRRQYALRKWIGNWDLLWPDRAKHPKVLLYAECLREAGVCIDDIIRSGLPLRGYLCDLARRGRRKELEALGIESMAAAQELWVPPMVFLRIFNQLAGLRLGAEMTMFPAFLKKLPSTADNWLVLRQAQPFLVEQLLDPLKIACLVKSRDNRWSWAIRPAYVAPGELRTLLEDEARRRQARYWRDPTQLAEVDLRRRSRSTRYRCYVGLTRQEQKDFLKSWTLRMVKRFPFITTQQLQQLLAQLNRKVSLCTLRRYRRSAIEKIEDERLSERADDDRPADAAEEPHGQS